MSDNFSIGDKVKIKKSSPFTQDFSYSRASINEEKIIFTISTIEKNKTSLIEEATLIAPGYGEIHDFGNGRIIIKTKYLEKL